MKLPISRANFQLVLAATLAVPALPQSPPTVVHASDIGFTYTLPSGWEFANPQPASPATTEEQPVQNPVLLDDKKGAGCVQVAFTARHHNPTGSIVAVTLPFDCYGQPMTAADLPDFAAGAAEGLKGVFDIAASATGSYTLDSHSFWIERAVGTAKGQQNAPVSTLEIACTLLTKGAACWITVSVDSDALRTFETGLVRLDGGPAHPLVSPEGAAQLASPMPPASK